MPSISVRIPDEDEDALEEVARLLDRDESTVIREALREGLGSIRIRLGVGRYQSGQVSVNQAAAIAGVSIAEWLDIARERNLTTRFTPEDIDAEADSALEL